MTGLLIALAAGLASATMFASIISGALMSLVLFYLAPLPLMVAALGWGSATALIGGVIAALGLGAIFGIPYMAAFALTVALPAWWLGHLTLLARPVSNDPQLANLAPALDWYPTGRILMWAAVFATITTISAMLTLGTDADTINASLRRGLMRIMGSRGTSAGESERVVDALVAIAPGAGDHHRDDDADTQSVAVGENHHHIRPAEAAVARPAHHHAAEDGAGRAAGRHPALLCRRTAGDAGADHNGRTADGLCRHRLRGVAHGDSDFLGPLLRTGSRLRRHAAHRLAATWNGRPRSRRCNFWNSTSLLDAARATAHADNLTFN